MNTYSNEHLKTVIMNLEIESFQTGDIILKQGSLNHNCLHNLISVKYQKCI